MVRGPFLSRTAPRGGDGDMDSFARATVSAGKFLKIKKRVSLLSRWNENERGIRH